MIIYTDPCPACSKPNNINHKQCKECATIYPQPFNVRRANLSDELAALTDRYDAAKARLDNSGLDKERIAFEKLVTIKGRAIINTKLDFVWEWLLEEKEEYQSYQRTIIENKRERALFENDSLRCAIDALLFSSNYDNVYAALTTDEIGLKNYGDISILLKDVAIAKRTSALEKNSYLFVTEISENGWKITQRLPLGYLSTWSNKHLLALAKCENYIYAGMDEVAMNRIILTSGDDRNDDIFIELYIDGKIFAGNVEKILVPDEIKSSLDEINQLKLEELGRKFHIDFVK